jgi:hypothetical protein
MNRAEWRFMVSIFIFLVLAGGISGPPTVSAEKTLYFSGYKWIVKSSGTQKIGPGPNYFSDSTQNVWVDNDGLHLKITYRNGKWNCAEVYTDAPLSYGKYTFYVIGRVDQLDKNVVFAMFNYLDSAPNETNELDIEISRWGVNNNQNAQFVVQPYYKQGNMRRFDMKLNGTYTTHSFEWKKTSVLFQSLHGHYSSPPSQNYVINQWTYKGSDIPKQSERVHINLWLMKGMSPSNGREVEIVIKMFKFSKANQSTCFNTSCSWPKNLF